MLSNNNKLHKDEGTLIKICSLLNYNLPFDDLRLSLPSHWMLDIVNSFKDESSYDLILCGKESSRFLYEKFHSDTLTNMSKPYVIMIAYENDPTAIEYLLNKTIDEVFTLPATAEELVLYLNDILRDKFDELTFQ